MHLQLTSVCLARGICTSDASNIGWPKHRYSIKRRFTGSYRFHHHVLFVSAFNPLPIIVQISSSFCQLENLHTCSEASLISKRNPQKKNPIIILLNLYNFWGNKLTSLQFLSKIFTRICLAFIVAYGLGHGVTC